MSLYENTIQSVELIGIAIIRYLIYEFLDSYKSIPCLLCILKIIGRFYILYVIDKLRDKLNIYIRD